MPPASDRQHITLWQWAILFVVIPLWVTQLRFSFNLMDGLDGWLVWQKLDFNHYYITAERVLKGSPEVYCAAFTEEETSRRGIDTGDVLEPTNPPLLSLALTPIAYGPMFESWLVYTTLGLLALTLALWSVMARSDGLSSTASKARLLLVILASSPMLSLLQFSQVQGYLVALILLAWMLAPKHPALSGALFGLTIALKCYTAPLLAFMFLTRNYRMLRFALLTAVIGTLLPHAIDSRLSISQFIACGSAHVSTWAIESSYTQSIPGLLRSIAYFTLLPLEAASFSTIRLATQYGGALLWIASGFIVGLLFRNRADTLKGLLAATAFSTLCAPVAWPHYFLLTWPYLVHRWSRLSPGTRLILWFSFPLCPIYITAGHIQDEISAVTHPLTSSLVWIPGTVFTIQFLSIFYKDIMTRNQ
jgi:hypothetical protein